MRTGENNFDSTVEISYAIVVCTKNRPKEIDGFLSCLNNQHSSFLESVVIVDGSSECDSERWEEFNKDSSLTKPKYIFLRTNGGKPSALNLSMNYLRTSKKSFDAVVFLDDDISFRLEDIETGIKFLKVNDVCGLSPIIVNEGDTCLRVQKLNRSSFFHFRKGGVLTKGGDNHWFNYQNIRENWLESDWLPGGAVIYDWSRIMKLSFTESLENPKLMGYALGDDVDFSIKAGRVGKLGCLQEIQVIHSSSPASYRNPRIIDLARARWKAYLVQRYPIEFPVHRVVMIEALRAIWHGALKGKPRQTYDSLSIFFQEFIGEMKNQELIQKQDKDI